MVIDHIGIAVRSIGRALPRWEQAFGYGQATEVVTNTRQRVKVVFLEREGSLPVKLIEPADDASPIATFTRQGGGFHHVCFRVGSVDHEVARLAALGLRTVAEPQPGEAFEGSPIAFMYAGDGLNIELIDTERRAGRLPPDSEPHPRAEAQR